MYQDFFGITEAPFSIVPSARFLYLSERHREALTHMLSGLTDGGGFGLLTGEVGTGKTTVLRAMISRLPQQAQVAVILNPALSSHDLLATICDELGLSYRDEASFKQLTDIIYQHLIANHAAGRQTLLLVDEAQHLMPDVLEQLRLLTNLETDSRKLLKVVLIGQPELQQLLQQERLRQLAQRITSRYHLLPLTETEVSEYIHYRLSAVDCLYPVFNANVISYIAKQTQGVPRLINLVCDKSMQLACQGGTHSVTKTMAIQACEDILSWQIPSTAAPRSTASWLPWTIAATLCGVMATVAWQYWPPSSLSQPLKLTTASAQVSAAAKTITPVAATTTTSVESRLAEVINDSRQQRNAMQSLYQLWGFDTALNQATCATSSRIALTCFSGSTTLARLGLINRPVIVTLKDGQQQPFYAVVYAITDDRIELLLDHQRISVTPAWFEARWDGQFSLLWRPPLGDKTTIRFGQSGARVAWLNQQLNTFLGDNGPQVRYFDQTVLDKLRRFQRSQDIAADGIAGPMTLMILDSALNFPGPTLQPEQA
ncbi:general secretion pathway protein GspA [Photobacterium kishitanii]|nr:AAA family ATPase [Photobacterium kishitanii]KJG09313.1 general secretion pathway protein GspA [Photobacterium kishitanii]KJG59259.1 general secretion pathway protein GspA [Photobacterium kishitanii]KJG62254.1 general secretion pathway protein GspA [Photobacterium kishitanii]KJG67410.1 general secretion pathway protein GspA [Photobacterium kishitanii]KJG69390.1 general secretion pathway protein GspA [Photobacterium kishitanii]